MHGNPDRASSTQSASPFLRMGSRHPVIDDENDKEDTPMSAISHKRPHDIIQTEMEAHDGDTIETPPETYRHIAHQSNKLVVVKLSNMQEKVRKLNWKNSQWIILR
jgi:hypothetical protein